MNVRRTLGRTWLREMTRITRRSRTCAHMRGALSIRAASRTHTTSCVSAGAATERDLATKRARCCVAADRRGD
jgi:hypothetical protein